MEPVVGIPIEVQKVTDRINDLLREYAEQEALLSFYRDQRSKIPIIKISYDLQGQLVLKTEDVDMTTIDQQ